MTDEQAEYLALQVPRLRALRTLEESRLGRISLTGEGVYRAVLDATGDEDEASDALADYLKREMDAGKTPE